MLFCTQSIEFCLPIFCFLSKHNLQEHEMQKDKEFVSKQKVLLTIVQSDFLFFFTPNPSNNTFRESLKFENWVFFEDMNLGGKDRYLEKENALFGGILVGCCEISRESVMAVLLSERKGSEKENG